jgi:hypothetical protein
LLRSVKLEHWRHLSLVIDLSKTGTSTSDDPEPSNPEPEPSKPEPEPSNHEPEPSKPEPEPSNHEPKLMAKLNSLSSRNRYSIFPLILFDKLPKGVGSILLLKTYSHYFILFDLSPLDPVYYSNIISVLSFLSK